MLTMQMRLLVSTVWLYDITGSGLSLGLLGVIQLAVQLPAVIYGGTLADQIDRKKLMAVTQSFSFVLISIMAALVFLDKLTPFHIYAVTAILGVTSVLGNPARSALTANVVPRTHLMHAVTLNTAIFQIGAVVAPLGFAGIHELFGIKVAFAAAAVLAFPSTFLPLLIRARTVPEKRTDGASVIKRTWEGFLYVKSHPILPGLYIMDIGVTVVSFYRQIMPLVADRLFKGGPAAVGLLQSANSLGGVIGTFAVLFLTKYRAKGMLVIYATLVYGVLLILFGVSTSLWIGALVLIGLGATDAIGMTTRQTTVQLTTPDNMRGRAVSFSSVSAMSANNIGTFEVGFMSDAIGAPNTLIFGGVVAIMVVLIVWRLVKGIREYRYP
jgi:MFS family permease